MKRCALCGTELPEPGAFCASCGVALGLSCPQCSADNNPKAQRCGSCGVAFGVAIPAPSPPSRAPRESRRIVTVLFADIVGYTSLVEAHGGKTEEVRSLLQDCFNALSKNVLDNGGIVEKFIGDAICALFGAPAVHEDDPQRALSCALSMRQTMERLNEHRAESDESADPLALRVGICTGEVVGGTAEHAGQEQYSVTGDAVNTASRLQAAAEPGQTLVSAATEQLARDQFVLEPAGTLKLKGKRVGVPAFCLLERRRHSTRSDGDLVNRQRELEHLGFCLTLAGDSRCQLVEIAGDAGVGKSRLVEAFMDQSRASALILRGDCPTSMAEPLHPFVTISRGLLASLAAGRVPHAADSAVGILTETVAGNAAAVTENQAEEVAAAIQELVRIRSNQEPVIVIVENAHRADRESLDVLQRLIARLRDERLLLLWTRRSGEELIVQGESMAEYTRMALRPLADDDAERLMLQLLGDVRIAEPLERRIVERSGGNPLYIEAMVRAILDEGEAFDGGELSGVDIPTTVQGLVQARLDSLPEPERLAAQEAAVAGREFDGRLLERVDLFGIEVAAALEALSRRGMIDHVGGATYRFRHVLTQEVCYDTMLQALRSELHREIADAVVDLYPERAVELAAYRADHYAKAGDTDRAVEVLVEAGVSET